ncbi:MULTISPECIES: PRC-barrel domain containing protein [Streptomyces]|uniref:PRC-barrel domain containing protein n=1 Tax=Streptomyces TaxID=1883 RepID=UPI000F73A67A|nr:PRC-barrel domain containing protein [Streptomyces sp. WAC05292]RSS84598.1 PRC-barrel domain containing protein [Streptomyces sp. WAC05292]
MAGMDMAGFVGFRVDASDGHIGKIDRHSEYVGRQFIVVDTGPWIFGRHVVVPASLVARVDEENETVHLSASRDQVRHSPEFESGRYEDDVALLQVIERYYADGHT